MRIAGAQRILGSLKMFLRAPLRAALSHNAKNKIPRPAADIVVDAADIFAEQAKTDELKADKDKEQREQSEDKPPAEMTPRSSRQDFLFVNHENYRLG